MVIYACIGYISMPANRASNAYQQSEFATVAGGNYQGTPNIGNEYYPRGQFDPPQGYQVPNQSQYNNVQQQPLMGGAQAPSQPNNQNGVQEVQRSGPPDQQSKPVIRSEQDLSKSRFVLDNVMTLGLLYREIC